MHRPCAACSRIEYRIGATGSLGHSLDPGQHRHPLQGIDDMRHADRRLDYRHHLSAATDSIEASSNSSTSLPFLVHQLAGQPR